MVTGKSAYDQLHLHLKTGELEQHNFHQDHLRLNDHSPVNGQRQQQNEITRSLD